MSSIRTPFPKSLPHGTQVRYNAVLGPNLEMDKSIRSTILRVVEVAWRRRFLLVVPMLIMLPASLAYATFLGGSYAARSLVMLQQTVASNPLAHDTSEPNADRMAQMLKGLRALLASEYVLSPVIDNSGGNSLDAATRASRVSSLAKNVSVDLLGNDFLEFRLIGKSPSGLGGELQSIMINLIGALERPPGESAGMLALSPLRDELALKDRQSAVISGRIEELLPAGLAAAQTQIAQLTRRKSVLDENLKSAASLLDTTATQQSNLTNSKEPGSQAAALAPLQNEIININKEIETLVAKIMDVKQAQLEKATLTKTVALLRERLEAEQLRLGEAQSTTWDAMINAPERMIIVDPPKDPIVRISSRLYFVFTGVLGGAMLGVALVLMAEIFDTTLRNADQMIIIAGVPFLGSLPTLPALQKGRSPNPFSLGDQRFPSLLGSPKRLQRSQSKLASDD